MTESMYTCEIADEQVLSVDSTNSKIGIGNDSD